MKKRGVYSDETMKLLLAGYERPSLDREARASLAIRMRSVAEAVAGGAPRSAVLGKPPARRYLIASLSAAAGIAAAAFVGLYLASSATSGAPWALVAEADSSSEAGAPADSKLPPGMKAAKAIVRVDGDEPRVLRSANETITMLPGTVLEVSGRFMHAVSGDDSNVYTLTRGEALVDHLAGGFELLTPWAGVVPVGTVVRAEVADGFVAIGCEAGAIDVRPLDGASGYRLSEGDSISARLVGGRWVPTISRAAPAAAGPAAAAAPETAAPRDPGMLKPTEAVASTGLERGPTENAAAASGANAGGSGVADGSVARFVRAWSVEGPAGADTAAGLYSDGATVFAYLTAPSGDALAAYAALDGRYLGRTDLGGAYEKRAFDGDRVYLASGARLVAVELPSGKALWSVRIGPMGFGQVAAGGGRVYVPSADGTLYVLDRETGSVVRAVAVGTGLHGRPLAVDGMVVFSTIGKELLAYDEATWSLAWRASVPAGLLGDAPIAMGPLVVAQDSSGGLLAFRLEDGGRRWSLASGRAETVRISRAAGGAAYEGASGLVLLAEDGTVSALPSIRGSVLDAGLSGSLATTEGLYRLRGGGAIDGQSVEAMLAVIIGDDVLALTEDGRLELWRWKGR